MPLFDFKCDVCGAVFEKICSSSTVTHECPKCGESAQKQVCAPGGFKFNGSGFYITDYKNKP